MGKGDPPVRLRDLIRSIDERTASCTDLERLDVAVKDSELLRGIEDDLVGHFVDRARKGGASWTQIGERLGVTKQAAQQRHVRRGPGLFGRRRGPAVGPFARFDEAARQVVADAQGEARALGHNYIGAEHLLLALTKSSSDAALVLRHAGVTTDRVAGQIRAIVGTGSTEPAGRIPFTPRSKRALQLAARRPGRSDRAIHSADLLLGLLELDDGMAVEILDVLGVDRADLRRRAQAATER
jgi:hypothetical protein